MLQGRHATLRSTENGRTELKNKNQQDAICFFLLHSLFRASS